jgi:preprotein translocase subunit SecG
MQAFLIVLLVLIAIAVITLVLLQHGKGADIGASFGSGASSTVFGSQGSASFLVKLTFALAGLFFIVSIVLTNLASHNAKAGLNLDVPAPSTPALAVPVEPTKTVSNVPSVPLENKKK